jgi:prepilin signal peptidase PulO-like enzyme (type II secretory pathway)
MLPLSFFILGAIVASFAGVVNARLHTGQSFACGRSRCDACNAPLHPATLLPILSYIALRARATCCGAKISSYAPLSELILGGLFVCAYVKLGLSLALVFFLLALALLLVLVSYDLAHQILPPKILGLFVAVSAFAGALSASAREIWYADVLTALALGLSLLLVHVLSRGRAMGLADAPFVFALALLVGSSAFSGFIFSFWIGAVIGLIILLQRPLGSRMGVEVPFAPFLAMGFLLAYFTQWNPLTLLAGLL